MRVRLRPANKRIWPRDRSLAWSQIRFRRRTACSVTLATAADAAIMSAVVLRLSPKQIQTIAGFICGGHDPWPYRRMVDIASFVRFTGVEIAHDVEVGSRFVSACAFVEEADGLAMAA